MKVASENKMYSQINKNAQNLWLRLVLQDILKKMFQAERKKPPEYKLN